MIFQTDNKKLWLPEDGFDGNFKALLHNVSNNPGWCASAKWNLARLIARQGIDEDRTAAVRELHGNGNIVALKAFKDFYGIEKVIYDFFVHYLCNAAAGGGADKKFALFVGPVGTGKSHLLNKLKALWRQCEPLPALSDCPKGCNPLNLLYMVQRVATHFAKGKRSAARSYAESMLTDWEIAERLDWALPEVESICAAHDIEENAQGLARVAMNDEDDFVTLVTAGLSLPSSTRNGLGYPCPFCQARVLGLFGRAQIDIAQFPIGAIEPASGQKVVDVPELDTINFDPSIFIGRLNRDMIGRVRAGDPSAALLDGYAVQAYRGIFNVAELIKNSKESWRIYIEMTQSYRIALPPVLASWGADHVWEGIPLGQTNWAEYTPFMKDKKNEALHDRMDVFEVTYPLERRQARRVTEKMSKAWLKPVQRGGVCLHPLLLDYESFLRTASCLTADEHISMLDKVRIYDGERVRPKGGANELDRQELKARAGADEGREGISPRTLVEGVLHSLCTEAVNGFAESQVRQTENGRKAPCVTTREFRDRVLEELAALGGKEVQARMKEFISTELEDWRRKQVAKYVRAAFLVSYEGECQIKFDEYIEHASTTGINKQVKAGGAKLGNAEVLKRLQEVEAHIGIKASDTLAAERFRREAVNAVNVWVRAHREEPVPWTIYAPLSEAIEKQVLQSASQLVRTVCTTKVKSSGERTKFDAATARLISDYKFCAHCADDILQEVSNNPDILAE